MRNFFRQYHYKNVTFTLVSIVLAVFLYQQEAIHVALGRLGELGYVGALVAGILFVSMFTVSIATVLLVILTETLNPVEVAVIAGLGAVVGDLMIFQYIRNQGLVEELKDLFQFLRIKRFRHLIRSKYFSWTLPVVGAIIIASPLPDELGVTLLGISRLKIIPFMGLSYILNTLGIFVIIGIAEISHLWPV